MAICQRDVQTQAMMRGLHRKDEPAQAGVVSVCCAAHQSDGDASEKEENRGVPPEEFVRVNAVEAPDVQIFVFAKSRETL